VRPGSVRFRTGTNVYLMSGCVTVTESSWVCSACVAAKVTLHIIKGERLRSFTNRTLH
jgi:hypothetical protein